MLKNKVRKHYETIWVGKMNMKSLPVLVYHHVNNLNEDITQDQFERQLIILKEAGYHSILLKDWINGEKDDLKNVISITFDDGYLDNWVYAYPLLKKYGFNATIFVSTVRPIKNGGVRYNIEDVWNNRIGENELPEITGDWYANHRCVGSSIGSEDFLTWDEMKIMEKSGHVDIQSHAHFHRDFYVSNQIVDFNRNAYFGVGWATDNDERIGIPIYPRKSAMMARRFYDDRNLRSYVAEKVKGEEYFAGKTKKEYMKELLNVVENYKKKYKIIERYETQQEQKKRIYEEIKLSKQLIENELDKQCEIICWPWGEYNQLSIRLAKESGMKAAVSFVGGLNNKKINGWNWDVKRIPPEKDAKDFIKSIRQNTNIYGCRLYQFKKNMHKNYKRIRNRMRDGQLIASMKRMVCEYKKRK
jgi:hypothetical protein